MVYNKKYSCKSKAPVQLINRAASSVGLQRFRENDYWQVQPCCWMSSHCNESRKAMHSTASSVAHVDWIVNWAGVKLQYLHAVAYYVCFCLFVFRCDLKKIPEKCSYILVLSKTLFINTKEKFARISNCYSFFLNIFKIK